MCAIHRPKGLRAKRDTTGSPLDTVAKCLPRAAKSSSQYKLASRGRGSAGPWDLLVTPPWVSPFLIECCLSQFQRRNLHFREEV